MEFHPPPRCRGAIIAPSMLLLDLATGIAAAVTASVNQLVAVHAVVRAPALGILLAAAQATEFRRMSFFYDCLPSVFALHSG